MKRYIKQRVFSWRDRFSVLDEQGNPCYYVEGELFSLGKRLHVWNSQGEEVLTIVQKPWRLLLTYQVSIGGNPMGEIRKEFTILFSKYVWSALGLTADGKFLGHEYAISRGNRKVADISKAYMSWGDSYELEVGFPGDELAALAMVLAIDCALAADNG